MPIKYIPYHPDTIEGQAILNNLSRTQGILRYQGSDQTKMSHLQGMPYYEVAHLETVGSKDTTKDNLLIRGSCVSACAYLKERGKQVDLVFIDPPFASGADYAKKVYIRRNPHLATALKKAEEELDMSELRAFEEKMYGDIWQKADYLNWMYENLLAIKSVMSDDALLFVYIDYHIGHYVKILLDEIFGEDNFRNEIIVKRITKNLQRQFDQVQALPQGHDTLFLYTKNSDMGFKPLLMANPNFAKKPNGYWKDFWSNADRPTMRYDILSVLPTTGQWKWSKKRADVALQNYQAFEAQTEYETVKAFWAATGKTKEFIRKSPTGKIEHWIKPMETKFVNTIWTDISAYASGSKQYATEKSENLLCRVLEAHPNNHITVADFFGGSGVTAKVAHDLGHGFVHVDVGNNSLQTSRDRLKAAGANFQVLNVQDGVNLFRNPQQTMDKLAQLIPGMQQKDTGLSPFWFGVIQDSQWGAMPVYVPNLINSREKIMQVQMGASGKVMDVPLLKTIFFEELPKLPFSAKKIVVYYVDCPNEAAVHQFIQEYNPSTSHIELRDLKQVLHATVSDDELDFTLETEQETAYRIQLKRFVSDHLFQKINAFNEKGQLQAMNKKRHFKPIHISDAGLELIEWVSIDANNTEGVWHSSSEIKINKLGYMTINGKQTKQFWDGTISSPQKPLRIKVRNICGDETIFSIIE